MRFIGSFEVLRTQWSYHSSSNVNKTPCSGKQEARISAVAALINARFGGSVFEPQHRNQALPHSIFMYAPTRVLLMVLTKISSDSNQSRHTCLGDMNMRSPQYIAI
ncbi:hypothetical protein VPH35_108845 [Triticum aestivum]